MQSLMLLDQAWDILSRFIAVTTPVSFQTRPRADPCHPSPTLAPTLGSCVPLSAQQAL